MTRALVVVDVQNDFCEGGSLAVAGGNEVAFRISNHIRGIETMHSHFYDYIVATKDIHQPHSDNGGHFGNPPDFVDSWPAHCVRGEPGSEFHPAIKDVEGFFDAVFFKGYGEPAYSGFQGWHQFAGVQKEQCALHGWLQSKGVDELTIVGIATDYCVKATALDAVDLGYKVNIPESLTVAVGGDDARYRAIKKVYEAQDQQRLDSAGTV